MRNLSRVSLVPQCIN